MKEMNGNEQKQNVMFGMSSTQDHSEGFERKEGHKIREREKEIDRSTYISYRKDLEVVVILIAYSYSYYYNNNLL